jgi:hypothetical protein
MLFYIAHRAAKLGLPRTLPILKQSAQPEDRRVLGNLRV